MNKEREQLTDIYELVHGIKPKQPVGAYRMFIQEKIKNNEIKNLSEGCEKWKQLNDDEKEKYISKSHRCILAYKYKKMIYKKKSKKLSQKSHMEHYNNF